MTSLLELADLKSQAEIYRPADLPITAGYIKIMPELGIASIRNKHAGGFRVWTLARHLDQDGCGHITQRALWERLTQLIVGIVSAADGYEMQFRLDY